MSKRTFRDLFEEAERHDDYWIEGAALRFTEEVARLMEAQGVTRTELAARIGTSPAYVTKILSRNVNFTLATMAKLARALGAEVCIHLAPHGTRTRWIERSVPKGKPLPSSERHGKRATQE